MGCSVSKDESPSPFASPDHVELEEFPPSTFDEVPPSETSVKTEKTRQRTNTRAARNIPSTAPTGSDQELAKWLSDNNIDTTAWGEGNAKSVGSLRNEILSKESTLVLEEGRPLRSLRVAKVRVQRSEDDPRYLWETKQLVKEAGKKDRVRERDVPLSEKLKFDETPEEAALRGISEELDGKQGKLISHIMHEEIEVKPTNTYPGLHCRYTFYEIGAIVESLPADDFTTIESDGNKTVTHYWKWRRPLVQPDDVTSLSQTQTRLLERLFGDCSYIKVSMLHGGFSGDIVLRVSPFYTDPNGGEDRPDDPTVVKLGGAQGIVNEVKQTAYVLSIGGDAVKVMRGPLFTDEQSTNALQYADSQIDGPLRERLLDGSLRLLKCDWLAASSSSDEKLGRDTLRNCAIILRRQDLPMEAFFNPQEAAELLDRGNRSILAVSHCWQTAKHPDPHGFTLQKIRAHLASDASTRGCGLFWDVVSMHQKDDKAERKPEEKIVFNNCLAVMASCYASITGTAVLRVREVPKRPASYDGLVIVFNHPDGLSKAEIKARLGAAGGDPKVKETKDTPWGKEYKFSTHEQATNAVESLAREWGIALMFNDRRYDGDGGRGWCIFEGGVCMTVAAHLARAERMNQLPRRFELAQKSREKVIDLLEGKPSRVPGFEDIDPEQLLESTKDQIEGAVFTGKGDKQVVHENLDTFYNAINSGLSQWGKEKKAAMKGEELGSVALEMAGACWILPEFQKSLSDTGLIKTLKTHVTRSLTAPEDHTPRMLPTKKDEDQVRPADAIRELFGPGGPLRNMFVSTAKSAPRMATEPSGFIETALLEVLGETMKVFLAGVPRDEWPEAARREGYSGAPAALERCFHEMESHPAAKRFMHEVRTSGKAKKWYASSIVRDCPTNVWGDEGTCAPLIELLELLTEIGRVGGGQLNGLMGCKPLTAFGHGDLNLSNVLVDVQGSLWLIDFAKSDVQGLFADAAKVLAVLLFEHFPTALGLAELQKIAAESPRDLERIMASFDLSEKDATKLLDVASDPMVKTTQELIERVVVDPSLAGVVPRISRGSYEAGVMSMPTPGAFKESICIIDALLAPDTNGNAPQLWEMGQRGLPKGCSQQAHATLDWCNEIIKHSLATTIKCWECRGEDPTSGSKEDEAKGADMADAPAAEPMAAVGGAPRSKAGLHANLHPAHLLFPLLQLAISALRYRQLSANQKEVAWHAVQKICTTLKTSLAKTTPPPPPGVVSMSRTVICFEINQPVIHLEDQKGRLLGTEGIVEFALAQSPTGPQGEPVDNPSSWDPFNHEQQMLNWDAMSQLVLPWTRPKAREVQGVVNDVRKCAQELEHIKSLIDKAKSNDFKPEKRGLLPEVMTDAEGRRLREIWPEIAERLAIFDAAFLLHGAVRSAQVSIKQLLEQGEQKRKDLDALAKRLQVLIERKKVEVKCMELEDNYFRKDQAIATGVDPNRDLSKVILKKELQDEEKAYTFTLRKEKFDVLKKLEKELEQSGEDHEKTNTALQKDAIVAWKAGVRAVEQRILKTDDLHTLAVRRLRNANATGLRRYAKGQKLHVCIDQVWHAVTVADVIEQLPVKDATQDEAQDESSASSRAMSRFANAGKSILRMASFATKSQDKAGEHYVVGVEDEFRRPSGSNLVKEGQSSHRSWRYKIDLHPFNHAPSVLDAPTFEALWKRHAQDMRRKHSSIVDALSGKRLDITQQLVPIKMDIQSSVAGRNFKMPDIKNVEDLSQWLEQQYKKRVAGDASEASCVLLTGKPAAGKTCMMSQLITLALADRNGNMRPQPLLVPILIKIQDLQKYLLSTTQGMEEEFSKAWNWVDAYLRIKYGPHSEQYGMMRQALMSRRALLLLDGIDEGGKARDRIESHIANVLAPQGFAMLVTSRPSGIRVDLFEEKFGMNWEVIGFERPSSGDELVRLGTIWRVLRSEPTKDSGYKELKLGSNAAKLVDSVKSIVNADPYVSRITFTLSQLTSFFATGLKQMNSIREDSYIEIDLRTAKEKELARRGQGPKHKSVYITLEKNSVDSKTIKYFDDLHRALRQGKTHFTAKELDTLRLDLHPDEAVFVEVDGLYYRPSEAQQRFLRIELQPLTGAQQERVIRGRLKAAKLESCMDKLMEYIDTKLTNAGGEREITGNPLMLSMMISIFESRQANAAAGEIVGMPEKTSELYGAAMKTMLERVNRKERGSTSAAAVPYLVELLQAVAFEAHSNEQRIIEMHHLYTAALRIARDQSIDIAEMLKLQDLKQRVKVLEQALSRVSADIKNAVSEVVKRVSKDSLPLLSLWEESPLRFQFSHLSFQEYYAVKSISESGSLFQMPKGQDQPWRWRPFFNNALKLGGEDNNFSLGLLFSCKLNDKGRHLDLSWKPFQRDSKTLEGDASQGTDKSGYLALVELTKTLDSVDVSYNTSLPEVRERRSYGAKPKHDVAALLAAAAKKPLRFLSIRGVEITPECLTSHSFLDDTLQKVTTFDLLFTITGDGKRLRRGESPPECVAKQIVEKRPGSLHSFCGVRPNETSLTLDSRKGDGELKEDDALFIASDLKCNTELKELNIHMGGNFASWSRDDVESNALREILSAMVGTTSITCLDLSTTHVQHGDCVLLAELVPMLTHLSVKHAGLDVDSIRMLVKAAYGSAQLSTLDLSGQSLSNSSRGKWPGTPAKDLFEKDVFKSTTGGTKPLTLRLQDLLMPPDAISLAHALRLDKRITALDVSNTGSIFKIGATGCAALANALKTHVKIETLNLRGNQVLDEGGRALLDAIQLPTCSLTNLDFSHNHISGAVLAELHTAGMQSTSITQLCGSSVDSVPVSPRGGPKPSKQSKKLAATRKQALVERVLPPIAMGHRQAHHVDREALVRWGALPVDRNFELAKLKETLAVSPLDERLCVSPANSLVLVPPQPRPATTRGMMRLGVGGCPEMAFARWTSAMPAMPGRCRVYERPGRLKGSALDEALDTKLQSARAFFNDVLQRLDPNAFDGAPSKGEVFPTSGLSRRVGHLVEGGDYLDAERHALRWLRRRADVEEQRRKLIRSGKLLDEMPFVCEEHNVRAADAASPLWRMFTADGELKEPPPQEPASRVVLQTLSPMEDGEEETPNHRYVKVSHLTRDMVLKGVQPDHVTYKATSVSTNLAGRYELRAYSYPVSGLNWRKAGNKKPSNGKELRGQEILNEALAAALCEGQTHFSEDEREEFGIDESLLRNVDIIKAGTSFFEPYDNALDTLLQAEEDFVLAEYKPPELDALDSQSLRTWVDDVDPGVAFQRSLRCDVYTHKHVKMEELIRKKQPEGALPRSGDRLAFLAAYSGYDAFDRQYGDSKLDTSIGAEGAWPMLPSSVIASDEALPMQVTVLEARKKRFPETDGVHPCAMQVGLWGNKLHRMFHDPTTIPEGVPRREMSKRQQILQDMLNTRHRLTLNYGVFAPAGVQIYVKVSVPRPISLAARNREADKEVHDKLAEMGAPLCVWPANGRWPVAQSFSWIRDKVEETSREHFETLMQRQKKTSLSVAERADGFRTLFRDHLREFKQRPGVRGAEVPDMRISSQSDFASRWFARYVLVEVQSAVEDAQHEGTWFKRGEDGCYASDESLTLESARADNELFTVLPLSEGTPGPGMYDVLPRRSIVGGFRFGTSSRIGVPYDSSWVPGPGSYGSTALNVYRRNDGINSGVLLQSRCPRFDFVDEPYEEFEHEKGSEDAELVA